MAKSRSRSRKSTKACPRGSRAVKAHRHGSKRVKPYCRKSVSRSPARSPARSRSPARRLKCKEGQVRVKSHRHGSKRVKPYCRKSAERKLKKLEEEVQELKEEIKEEERKEEEEKEEDCGLLSGKDNCEAALGKDNLRRCRYNFSSSKCEFLPMEFRQRATMQVGGDAEVTKYEAPEKKALVYQQKKDIKEKDDIWRSDIDFGEAARRSRNNKQYFRPEKRQVVIPESLGLK